jgi:multidrug efflux pump subunit AcrA (membrane-fusion protein)
MKQWIHTAAAVLAVLLGCTSCGTKEVVPELLDSAAVSVDTAEVVKGTFYDVEVYDSAVVPAVETASFVSGGVLEEKKAKLGDTVKKGDVLALLDTEELEEQIEDLQDEIAYTEQNNAYTLQQLQLRLQIAQLELKQLTGKSGVNANVAAAMPPARLLTTVPPSESESSESTEEQTSEDDSELESSESSEGESSEVESSEPESSEPESSEPETSEPEDPGPSAGSVSLAQSKIEQCQVDLSQEKEWQALVLKQLNDKLHALEEQVQDNRLLAPISGTIVYETSSLHGETVQAYQPMYCIADESKRSLSGEEIVEAQIKSADRVEVQIGEKRYEVEYQAYTLDEYSALVLAGEDTPTRFQFADEKAAKDVKIGDYAAVYLYRSIAKDALYVPVNALHEDGGVRYVYRASEDGQERVTVETGVESDSFVEITSGLQEGDVVYVQE